MCYHSIGSACLLSRSLPTMSMAAAHLLPAGYLFRFALNIQLGSSGWSSAFCATLSVLHHTQLLHITYAEPPLFCALWLCSTVQHYAASMMMSSRPALWGPLPDTPVQYTVPSCHSHSVFYQFADEYDFAMTSYVMSLYSSRFSQSSRIDWCTIKII